MLNNFNQIRKNYGNQIWYVFVPAAFFTYSWSIIIFFWDFPAFPLKYTLFEIISYFAYLLLFSFFESMVITSLVFILSFLLPGKYLREHLPESGSILIFIIGSARVSFRILPEIAKSLGSLMPGISFNVYSGIVFGIWLFFVLSSPLLLVRAAKGGPIVRITNNIVERLTTLVGLYLILSIFGILIVFFRNISLE
jgi:hypothetical protein